MLDWIAQHQKILSVVASFSSLVIWIVYAQLLYLGFRRQRISGPPHKGRTGNKKPRLTRRGFSFFNTRLACSA